MRMPRTAAGSAADDGASRRAARRTRRRRARRPAAEAPAGDGAAPGGWRARAAGWPARLPGLARRHWLAIVLLAAGLALRVLAQFSYGPALIYIDSVKYLYGAWPGADPARLRRPAEADPGRRQPQRRRGRPARADAGHRADPVPAAAAARRCRAGWPRWPWGRSCWMPTSSRWNRRSCPTSGSRPSSSPGWPSCCGGRGSPRGRACWPAPCSAWPPPVRQVGEILIVPALLFVLAGALLARQGGWRQALRTSVALTAAFAVPILAYCAGSYVMTGHFWLSRNGYEATYGRMAALADCATLKLPSYARPLCPTPASRPRAPTTWTTRSTSPLRTYEPPAGVTVRAAPIIAHFNHAVLDQQPLRVVSRSPPTRPSCSAVTRHDRPRRHPDLPLAVPDELPDLPADRLPQPAGDDHFALKLGRPTAPRSTASWTSPTAGTPGCGSRSRRSCARYQLYGGYTPGPLLLLCLLAGLAGALTVFRRRASEAQRQLALGATLFVADRSGRPADLGPVRVQLALPAAGPGHAAPGRSARHRRDAPLRPPPQVRPHAAAFARTGGSRRGTGCRHKRQVRASRAGGTASTAPPRRAPRCRCRGSGRSPGRPGGCTSQPKFWPKKPVRKDSGRNTVAMIVSCFMTSFSRFDTMER